MAKKYVPPPIGDDQCGARCYMRDSPRHNLQYTMTCTLPIGHEKRVHEEYVDGEFQGGWVDRAPNPDENVQQFPRATLVRSIPTEGK